uniref:Uncharacterized protein n=1 Tax=Acrobeloides nanus TaxID=290746 RepID=A0A914BW44_9BILA
MKYLIVFVLVISIFIYASAELDARKVEISSKKLVKLFGGRRLKECNPSNESDCLKGFKCCAWRRIYQCFPEHCPEMI